MVKLLAVSCAALFSCLAIAPASARAATSSQPSSLFTVQLLSINGSGCPVGSAAVRATSAMTFTVTYDDYLAAAGDGAALTDFRKDCQLDILVGLPSGWTFGIAGVQYRGFADLDAGARGQLLTSYYFPSQPGTFTQNHSVFGPTNSNYEFDDEYPVVTYAPCHTSAAVNINSSLQIFPGTNPSFFNELTMNSTDSPRLSFKHC